MAEKASFQRASQAVLSFYFFAEDRRDGEGQREEGSQIKKKGGKERETGRRAPERV